MAAGRHEPDALAERPATRNGAVTGAPSRGAGEVDDRAVCSTGRLPTLMKIPLPKSLSRSTKLNMNKIIKLFTQELAVVVLLGGISVITAWAGVQSSLLGGKSNDALSVYMEGTGKANNLFLTSELKYRTDLVVWADKQKTLSQGGDINAGYSAGSAKLFGFALPCLVKNPQSQLSDCAPYMDELYLPQRETLEQAMQSLEEYQVSSGQSDRLQMLTALLAVALFMLGITSVIHQEKLQFAIVLGATIIAIFSVAILFSVPVVSVSF